jgi:hypothetical protein
VIRGEQMPSVQPARVAGLISEWWPTSNRNGGRLQIGPAAQRLPRGMMRDLFEAGLNEAAGSLAASYGRWSFPNGQLITTPSAAPGTKPP